MSAHERKTQQRQATYEDRCVREGTASKYHTGYEECNCGMWAMNNLTC